VWLLDHLQRLTDKKKEIEEIIKKKRELVMDTYAEYGRELSIYDQHPADVASELYEREKEHGILELMEYELEKVNDALQKYEEGKYGVCEACGKAIETRRLERLINTTLCSNCAREHKNYFVRPAEEDVISPGAAFSQANDTELAGYDFFDQTTAE